MKRLWIAPALATALLGGTIGYGVTNGGMEEAKAEFAPTAVLGMTEQSDVETVTNEQLASFGGVVVEVEEERQALGTYVEVKVVTTDGMKEKWNNRTGSWERVKAKPASYRAWDEVSYDAVEAIERAKTYGEGRVTEWELKEKNGRLVYKVKLKTTMYETKVTLDAVTGDVIQTKKKMRS